MLSIRQVGIDYYVSAPGVWTPGQSLSPEGRNAIAHSLYCEVQYGSEAVASAAVELYAEVSGTSISLIDQYARAWLADWISSGVRSGSLQVRAHSFGVEAFQPVRLPASPGSETPSDSQPEEPLEQAWIELEVLDQNDEPVPNRRFRIEFPDGTVRQGRLDGQGRAHVMGRQSGNCVVTFLDLDQRNCRVA